MAFSTDRGLHSVPAMPRIASVLVTLGIVVAVLLPSPAQASGWGPPGELGPCNSCSDAALVFAVSGTVLLAGTATAVGIGLTLDVANGERPPWWWLVAAVPVGLLSSAVGTAVLAAADSPGNLIFGLPLLVTGVWDLAMFTWGLTLPRVSPTVLPTRHGAVPGVAFVF